MAWTTPRTWIAGELVTASIGNTHWRDNLQNRYDDGGVLHAHVRLTATITVTISADPVNDWNPTGLSSASLIRVTSSGADRVVNGLVAQPAGTVVWIANVGASQNLAFNAENGGSTAANRFTNAITIPPATMLRAWYDGTSSRWRLK